MKKINITLILVLVIFFVSDSLSRLYPWDFPGDITFMGLEKTAGDVKKTVFSLQNESEGNTFISIGTGFILKHKNFVVGVTCAHVLKPSLERKKEIYAGLNTSEGFERFRIRVVKIDESSDVAILHFERKTQERIQIENFVLDAKYLEAKPSFKEGRAIIIPGYPFGIGAKKNENNPVIRFGIVAQCSNEINFLIDGVSNPGNSGSPVFDTKEKRVIGMITAYKTDFINLYNERQELIARLPYNSGLSAAVSSAVIIKLLEDSDNQ